MTTSPPLALASATLPASSRAFPVLRVGALDDHPLYLRGLAACLAEHPGITMVHTGSCVVDLLGTDHLRADDAAAPVLDVVLLDSDLRDGTDLAANVAALVAAGLPVVVLATQMRPAQLATALRAGARDVLLKGDSEVEVVAALRRAASGTGAGPRRLLEDEPLARVRVSVRERQVLTELALGRSWAEVGQRLGISVTTARTHVVRVIAAMEAEGIEVRGGPREAVAIAQASGLIDPFREARASA